MSKTSSQPRIPRPLSADELARHGRQLIQLAEDFDRLTSDLRSRPENELLLPEMRRAMSQAGRTLLLLLHHRAVEPPDSLPPWLSWRTRSKPRPFFCASYAPPFQGHWSPPGRVRRLVEALVAGPEVVGVDVPRHLEEDSYPRFAHRHVFIESVAGWLGRRALPGIRVAVPEHEVVMGQERPLLVADEDRVSVVFDWVASPIQQRLLFLGLGPACAAACRHLAGVQKPCIAEVGTVVSREPLATFAALDDLLTDVSHATAEAGHSTHDTLFGERNLHGELTALAARSGEFRLRFTGPVRVVADFAVTSGHEALAFFAERVAGYAKVRRDTIPRIQAELDSARTHGRALVVEQKQAALTLAGEDFAKALVSSFSGWNKERAWIRRSIEDEFRPPSHERGMEPVATAAEGRASRDVGADLPRSGFVRMGDYWDVTFENVRKSIRHSKGMGYVGQLLAKPNVPIHSWTLTHGTEPPEAETAEATDDEAIDAIRQEINDLTALLEEATDVIERDTAEVKLKELKAYVASNSRTSKKRRIPRKERNQLDQTRETVGKAIQNAIRTIARHVPALGEHLRAHIDSPTGMAPCYRSADPSLSSWMLGG